LKTHVLTGFVGAKSARCEQKCEQFAGLRPPLRFRPSGCGPLKIEISTSVKELLGGDLSDLLKPVDCLGLWTARSGDLNAVTPCFLGRHGMAALSVLGIRCPGGPLAAGLHSGTKAA